MKKQKQTIVFTCVALTLVLALSTWSSVRGEATDPTQKKPILQDKMTDGDQGMAKQRHQLMEDMQAQDIELAKAVAKMNSSPKNEKMGLMADIITRMVSQRAEMNSRILQMQEQVMQYMIAAKSQNEKSGDASKEQK